MCSLCICLHFTVLERRSVAAVLGPRWDRPLSNEFFISLTSTWEPGILNMPCCWRPVGAEHPKSALRRKHIRQTHTQAGTHTETHRHGHTQTHTKLKLECSISTAQTSETYSVCPLHGSFNIQYSNMRNYITEIQNGGYTVVYSTTWTTYSNYQLIPVFLLPYRLM